MDKVDFILRLYDEHYYNDDDDDDNSSSWFIQLDLKLPILKM